ncbi:Para-nitrophenol 4-monooxygenase [Fusarium albosuccineum]|uniref:Para-nitrophenol 4-monooxygenase n=1 Tax=Fusarium albosuccineum TaxID=1237068 RepID=A0A8H4L4P6_9HYPO|nr:Para-nitrophenol 4-monooxygenase [Fusarium albosuccineum]
MSAIQSVLIVGAGPAGLILGILLAKAGIHVRLVERAAQPTDETRAVFYNPVAQYEFKRAGVYDDILERSRIPKAAAFCDMQGKKLFSMPGGGLIALMQNQLSAVVTLLGLGQDADYAWVDVDTPQGKQRLEAQYIVGCDGASSTVRRELLGREAMPGFTWDKQLVAADVRHDLLDAFPDAEDSNVFLDSENE